MKRKQIVDVLEGSCPAPIEDANLMTMAEMKERYGVKVGLSDHTMGYVVAVAAVALGAEVVEKHFIVDCSIGGPDAAFSMEQEEFTVMVILLFIIRRMVICRV